MWQLKLFVVFCSFKLVFSTGEPAFLTERFVGSLLTEMMTLGLKFFRNILIIRWDIPVVFNSQ